jgi:hypothetical protein
MARDIEEISNNSFAIFVPLRLINAQTQYQLLQVKHETYPTSSIRSFTNPN